jgi:ubiquinone biosynthesis protein COQ9
MAEEIRAALLAATLPHVAFDGWSDEAFVAGARDAGMDPRLARAMFPRGAVDLALAFHTAGDAAMVAQLAVTDQTALRYRDRIAQAVRFRLEGADREAVRRATALFALPHHAADGARAIWGTADRIWVALGDRSDDLNYYSKRAILSAVYSATLLYWLGDASVGQQATWAFLDRRIDNVMQFEKFKAAATANPLVKVFLAGPGSVLARITAPAGRVQDHLPGSLK